MSDRCKKHALTKPKVGRLSVTKRKRGINELTKVELTQKTQQELHDEVKHHYWIQTQHGTKFLDPAKYDTLEKLQRFKFKNPGCYMKNNINNMQRAFDKLNSQPEEAAAAPVVALIAKVEKQKRVNTDYTKL